MEKHTIASLKRQYPIEDVIGRYVRLHPAGQYWWGLCPFHNDRHPSLAVHPGRGTYHCYACGERGDVLSFIRKIEHCSFAEAVARLTGTPSIKRAISPQPVPEEEPVKAPSREELEAFLQTLLPVSSGDSDLTPTWLDFEVGQAPHTVSPRWKSLQGRLIFPLREEDGRLVGFAGRRTDDTDTRSPKYRNPSARDGFRKSEYLYGICQAHEAIRQTQEVFLVEGYKDVLAMHAAGYTQTVGLCGTALTSAHVVRLKPYVTRVWLVLDQDEAGWKGSAKAACQLWEAGLDPRVICLPEAGSDPDSLFREKGREVFRQWIQTACQQESEEQYWINRLRKGMGFISFEPIGTERRETYWQGFRICRQGLARVTGQLGGYATMDWRWV